MRFPRSKAEAERIVLNAIDGGVNYFDTAYIYPGSEKMLGEILAKSGKRADVYIGTKLPLVLCKKPEDFDDYFNKQLARLQTDYVDYYFLHNIGGTAHWKKYCDMGIMEWLEAKKHAGTIRHIGFSYHGSQGDFLEILKAYSWDFTMLQYNYYDENYQAGRTGVEAAAAKGVEVMIMEPLLGGMLATGLPKKAQAVFSAADARKTPAQWALEWLWNQPAVTTVVSGMSGMQVLEQNLTTLQAFEPFSDTRDAVYADVVAEFRKAYKVNCTGCNYCLPCPLGINIPACFAAYNTRYAVGYFSGMFAYVISTAQHREGSNSPRTCNQCGKCEKLCPQHIPIRAEFKTLLRKMEPWYMRAAFAVVRKVMSWM